MFGNKKDTKKEQIYTLLRTHSRNSTDQIVGFAKASTSGLYCGITLPYSEITDLYVVSLLL